MYCGQIPCGGLQVQGQHCFSRVCDVADGTDMPIVLSGLMCIVPERDPKGDKVVGRVYEEKFHVTRGGHGCDGGHDGIGA